MRLLSIVLLAVLSVLLVVSFGCTQRQEPSVDEPPVTVPGGNGSGTPVAPEQPCSSGNIVQKDECFANLAKTKGDSSICKNIYDVGKLDSCYSAFANGNLDVCKKINDAEMRSSCLIENAKRLKSEEVCDLIGNAEKKATCLNSVLPECLRIIEPEKRELCLALEKSEYTQCRSDWCFSQYGIRRSDENACALIKSPAENYACKAIVKNDVGECKMAPVAAVQDLCVQNAAAALDYMGGCDLATSGSTYRNSCYLHFALERRDGNICSKAEPEFTLMIGTSRNWCYQEYAKKAADASVCAKVTETLSKVSCYRDAAKENRMPSLCNALWTDGLKRDCYAASILYVDGGPVNSDCQLVDSADWKDKCYYKAAYVAYNQSLCGFIREGSADRDSCDALFGS